MEFEHQSRNTSPQIQGETALDRDTFERVWRRVMPEDRPDCPFELAGGAAADTGESGQRGSPPAPAGGSLPAVCPVPAGLLSVPAGNDVPCLGSASAVHTPQLQGYIEGELSAWRYYQILARRAGGTGGRVLAAIASDERRHAKRLSTAYFLISGVRYWPVERIGTPIFRALAGALRQRFAEEQREQGAYLTAAEDTADPCLRALYLELAGEEAEHAHLLRALLERM